MFIGVQMRVIAASVAQQFQSPIGDHLIGIHIGGSARTALNDIHHKLVMPTPVHNLFAGLDNGLTTGAVEQPQIVIGECRCLFDAGQRFDEVGIN